MSMDAPAFADWLHQAAVPQTSLTPTQLQVVQAAFGFLQQCGSDYYSRRLLSHFLLHCRVGLTTAAVARLCGFSRSSAVDHRGLSSKEVVQAAHHRLAGRAHGKLLPRYAGPIAQFLHEHPEATRWDVLDFIQRTWSVSVSRMALHRFLKKYGLNQTSRLQTLPLPATPAPTLPAPGVGTGPVVVQAAVPSAAEASVPLPPAEFFLPPPSTPAPSCSCPPPSTGWPSLKTASRTPTVPCSADY
jgi:hypothetical protein